MKMFYSILSGVFLFISFAIFVYNPSSWGGQFFQLLMDISVYTPFITSILGIVLAVAGIKGVPRALLILLHSFILLLFVIAFLMGTFGFQNP
ncbi:hypothetical protein EQV77_13135 [Halobacillus fulvus]|nr:hypothetical protein EQV77_13135 [Halobacillus fulvus]